MTKRKPLSLSRETLRSLSAGALSRAVGGADENPTRVLTCVTPSDALPTCRTCASNTCADCPTQCATCEGSSTCSGGGATCSGATCPAVLCN